MKKGILFKVLDKVDGYIVNFIMCANIIIIRINYFYMD